MTEITTATITREQVLESGRETAAIREQAVALFAKFPRVNGQVEVSLAMAIHWNDGERVWKRVGRAGVPNSTRYLAHLEAADHYRLFIEAAAKRGYTL